MKIEIKCRFDGSILFSHEAENNSMRLALEAAVSADAYLARANVAGANLDGANLAGAYLAGANLARAYLAGAYLAGAYLAGGEVLVGERPVFQIGPIGSRCVYFVAYLTDKGLRLRAGCFFGDLSKFEAKLDTEHADGIHGREYRAALELIKVHAEIWTPETTVIVANNEEEVQNG